VELLDLVGIPGIVPGPMELPGGCRFHPRCGYAVPGRCDTTPPDLVEVLPQHYARCLRVREIDLQGIR
jgi:oligopeptide/dipeptide ABC transporter ATP-binding protein